MIVVVAVVMTACGRTEPEMLSEEIVASPYPPQYEWAVMTVEGPVVGEVSVEEPQFGYEAIDGRISPSGIVLGFGSGGRRIDLRLEPYMGTGRYVVQAGSGSFTITLESGTWSTDVSGICSFVFSKVSAVQYVMKPSPPLSVESYEADLGFICPKLGESSGGPDLTILHGRMHAIFFRLPGDATGTVAPELNLR